jgi:uncharacterized protein YkwD
MRRCTQIACAAALALAALTPVARADDPSDAPVSPGRLRVERVQTMEQELLTAINAMRVNHGLRPLRASRHLRAAAGMHSAEMATRGYFEHSSANGTPFWRRVARFYPARGYRDWSVGENIAMGSPGLDAREALDEWLQSPPHRANLFDRSWRDAGIGAMFASSAPGCFHGSPTMVVTLDFGERRR